MVPLQEVTFPKKPFSDDHERVKCNARAGTLYGEPRISRKAAASACGKSGGSF